MKPPLHLETAIEIEASQQRVWDGLVDWASQGTWMIATRVTGTAAAVGESLEAFSGLGRVGFLDTMVVTRWEPPMRCDVDHTDKVVRGTGTFIVESLSENRAKLIWIEDLVIPGGPVGRAGFRLSQPLFMALVNKSLKRFAAVTTRSI